MTRIEHDFIGDLEVPARRPIPSRQRKLLYH